MRMDRTQNDELKKMDGEETLIERVEIKQW
jgi:hypothetical protein